jgi:hypothetical protein
MMNDKFDMNVMDEVGVEEGYDEVEYFEMRDIMMEVREDFDGVGL